jgi:ribonuclease VapC
VVVLDASALIAVLLKEPGFERVTAKLPGAWVSTVNLAEVFTRFIRDGHSTATVLRRLAPLAIEPVPFSAAHAAEAAELWPLCRGAGLSLGDRACQSPESVCARIRSLSTLEGDARTPKKNDGSPLLFQTGTWALYAPADPR